MAVVGVSWTVTMNNDQRPQMDSSCTNKLCDTHGMVALTHGERVCMCASPHDASKHLTAVNMPSDVDEH